MDPHSSSSWRPEPEPQNDLERRLPDMVEDPALHGQMFRMLWAGELTILMPDHPEMRDGFEVTNGSAITFLNYQDKDGPFIPIFTSEAAADYAVQKLGPRPWPLLATSAAEVIFRALNNGNKLRVIVNPGLSATITLLPEAIAHLVAGDFTHHKPGSGHREEMSVVSVRADKMPANLRDGIRDFCEQRPVPIGVYVFHPCDLDADTESYKTDTSHYNVILWLRHADGDFYNDFSLLIGKLIPENCKLTLGVMTEDDKQGLAYIQRCTPLWPVLPDAK